MNYFFITSVLAGLFSLAASLNIEKKIKITIPIFKIKLMIFYRKIIPVLNFFVFLFSTLAIWSEIEEGKKSEENQLLTLKLIEESLSTTDKFNDIKVAFEYNEENKERIKYIKSTRDTVKMFRYSRRTQYSKIFHGRHLYGKINFPYIYIIDKHKENEVRKIIKNNNEGITDSLYQWSDAILKINEDEASTIAEWINFDANVFNTDPEIYIYSKYKTNLRLKNGTIKYFTKIQDYIFVHEKLSVINEDTTSATITFLNFDQSRAISFKYIESDILLNKKLKSDPKSNLSKTFYILKNGHFTRR